MEQNERHGTNNTIPPLSRSKSIDLVLVYQQLTDELNDNAAAAAASSVCLSLIFIFRRTDRSDSHFDCIHLHSQCSRILVGKYDCY